MDAVGGVACHVAQVHQQRVLEVLQSLAFPADLRGDDALHARRQGRVAGGARVVIVEVAALLLLGELVAEQEHRQHDVGLLEYLVPVDHQRMVVQQQRELLRRRSVQVPRLAVQERLVLGMDAAFFIERYVHGGRRALPGLDLPELKPDRVHQRGVVPGPLLAQAADGGGGEIEVQPRHQVGVGVVVDHGGVLVRPGHAVDVEPLIGAVETEVRPQPGGLDEDLGADLAEHASAALHLGVAPDRVGDIGVDVVLGGALLEVGRSLLAVDGPPREKRPPLAHLPRPLPRPGQHAVPEPEQVPGDPRLGVRQERQDVDLGVPEVVALVGLPGQPLRRNTGPFGAPRPLRDLVEVPPDRLLLPYRIEPGLHLDVGAVPEPGKMRALALQECVEPVPDRAVQRPAAPVDELGHADTAGGLVGRVLGDPDRHAGLRVGREEDLARLVVIEGPRRVIGTCRVDHVVNADAQRHPAVGCLVAQKDALVSQFGGPHVEYPVRQHGRQVLGQVAGQVGVLAVEHQ